jgi:hypothetical protein
MDHAILEPSPLLIFQSVLQTDELHKFREDVLSPSKGVGVRMYVRPSSFGDAAAQFSRFFLTLKQWGEPSAVYVGDRADLFQNATRRLLDVPVYSLFLNYIRHKLHE